MSRLIVAALVLLLIVGSGITLAMQPRTGSDVQARQASGPDTPACPQNREDITHFVGGNAQFWTAIGEGWWFYRNADNPAALADFNFRGVGVLFVSANFDGSKMRNAVSMSSSARTALFNCSIKSITELPPIPALPAATPTNTPLPTATATSTNTPLPPTNTPKPTKTPIPPTSTPVPTATATATNTPIPTATPSPIPAGLCPAPCPNCPPANNPNDPVEATLATMGFGPRNGMTAQQVVFAFFEVEGLTPDRIIVSPGELCQSFQIVPAQDARGNFIPFKINQPLETPIDGWRNERQPDHPEWDKNQSKVPQGVWMVEGVTVRNQQIGNGMTWCDLVNLVFQARKAMSINASVPFIVSPGEPIGTSVQFFDKHASGGFRPFTVNNQTGKRIDGSKPNNPVAGIEPGFSGSVEGLTIRNIDLGITVCVSSGSIAPLVASPPAPAGSKNPAGLLLGPDDRILTEAGVRELFHLDPSVPLEKNPGGEPRSWSAKFPGGSKSFTLENPFVFEQDGVPQGGGRIRPGFNGNVFGATLRDRAP